MSKPIIKPLFTDIDGVLNAMDSCMSWHATPEGDMSSMDEEWNDKFDERCMRWYNGIVRITGCQVVISSTWRSNLKEPENPAPKNPYGKSWLNDVWARRGLPPILGRTGFADVKLRGEQIKIWLEKARELYEIPTYCILDDDGDMLPEQKDHFVQCNSNIGISEKEFMACLRILGLKEELDPKERAKWEVWMKH